MTIALEATAPAPFDDPENTLVSLNDTTTLAALREYADGDLDEPERTTFKERIVNDPDFYTLAFQALKQIADLLFYAASFQEDDHYDFLKLQKIFRASARTDPPAIRRLRSYFLQHHEQLLMGEPLSSSERANYQQRVESFRDSYYERLAMLTTTE